MPSAPILAVLAIGAMLAIGTSKTIHGVKKLGHQIGCVVRSGHKCPKPAPKP